MGTLGPKYILFGYMDPQGYQTRRTRATRRRTGAERGPNFPRLTSNMETLHSTIWELPKIGGGGGTLFGVLVIRILLFSVLY